MPVREMSARKAALFDMDRTLVREHTARLFTQYRRDLGEQGPLDALRVAYWLLLYTVGAVDAKNVARAALREFRGTSESQMIRRCQEWFPLYVKAHIAEAGRVVVERHRLAGDLLVIVTGATRYSAELLATELGIEHVVCSAVEVNEDGIFTGEVLEPLCFGEGKVTLTERFLNQWGIPLKAATFYSDSVTDVPLLEAAGDPVVVNPDFRLRRRASQRGWPILAW